MMDPISVFPDKSQSFHKVIGLKRHSMVCRVPEVVFSVLTRINDIPSCIPCISFVKGAYIRLKFTAVQCKASVFAIYIYCIIQKQTCQKGDNFQPKQIIKTALLICCLWIKEKCVNCII